MKDGARVEVAGIILVRQRPGSAKGVLFLTLEDETGIANAILWPDRFEAQRRIVMSAAMISVVGRVQREGLVIHVVADRIVDLTPMLRSVGDIDLPSMVSPRRWRDAWRVTRSRRCGMAAEAEVGLSLSREAGSRGPDPDQVARFPLAPSPRRRPGPLGDAGHAAARAT